MSDPGRGFFEKARFYAVKLPLILVLICLGYLLDFVIQLPFAVICRAAPASRRLEKQGGWLRRRCPAGGRGPFPRSAVRAPRPEREDCN